MAKCKEIPKEIRAQAKILHECGFSYRVISAKLKISLSAVCKTLKRVEELGTFESRPRSGRPTVSSIQDDRMIRRLSQASPKSSSQMIRSRLPASLRNISTRTVRRRLLDSGLKSYKPARKPRLSAKNIKDRLKFCKKYQNWSAAQWETVMFSDESTFTQFYSYYQHVRRPSKKRYDIKYVVPTVKQAAKVMVWGCISAFGRGALWFLPKNTTINGQVYLNILKEKLPIFMALHGTTHFQHDGAPCHSVIPVKHWIQQSGYRMIGPWPGNSPDLNIIENAWNMMKVKVAEKAPTSMDDLLQKIREVWVSEITPQYCRRLAESMPRRIKAVLENKGHHIKY